MSVGANPEAKDSWAALALFAGFFGFYAWRAQAGPGWLDSSEFAATAHLLSLPHPPGEPVHLLLAKLAALLPVGHVAARVAWLSSLFLALAVERYYRFLRRLCAVAGAEDARFLPALATAAFGLTLGMRVNGARAEVYALQAWLTFALLHLALAFRASGDARHLRLGGLVVGLLLANHPYLAVLALPGALLLAGRGTLVPVRFPAAAGFALLGLGAYAALPLRGDAGGLVGWGGASTAAGFFDMVSARAFQASVANPGEGARLGSLAVFLADQFGDWAALPVLCGAIAGAWLLARRAAAVAAGALLACVLGFASRALWPMEVSTPDTQGYFLVSVAVVIGLGTVALARARASVPAGRWIGGALLAGLVASIGPPARGEVEGAAGRALTARMLDSLAPDALVLLSDFNLLFVSWYLQAVEERRPDVTVVYRGFAAKPWYRERLAIHAPDALAALLAPASASRPVYVDYGIDTGWVRARIGERLAPEGLLLRVGGKPAAERPEDWLVDRDDLDAQTERQLLWLHFRRACFHVERGQPERAAWHLSRARRLNPLDGHVARLLRGDAGACEEP